MSNFFNWIFCNAADSSLTSADGAMLKFSSWDQGAAVWKRATFSKMNESYDLYDSGSKASVGVGINSDSLSPSKICVGSANCIWRVEQWARGGCHRE